MPIPPGSRLGPFEILSPLGAGGMGEVYRARDPRLQRDVARFAPPITAEQYGRLDGREIASVDMNGRQPQLVRRRIGSSEPPVVVNNANAHPATLPQWSPTGEWIAYRSTDGLTIVKPDGQQRQVLAPNRPPALALER